MQQSVIRERVYLHPIEQVWQAISDAAALSKWFIQADFRPEVGYAYTFTHESTTVRGEVLVADPPRELTYTWIVGGTEAVTQVRWLLEQIEEGTLLRIEHTGFEEYADAAAQMIESTEGGWARVTTELVSYLDTRAAGS